MNLPFQIIASETTDFVGGWTGEQLDKLGNIITTGIYNGFVMVMETVCDILFITAKGGIIGCIIIFIASKDQKAISLGLKLLLLYAIASIVRNNL